MSEIHFVSDLPPVHRNHRSRAKHNLIELLKFLGIFAVIFAVLTLIVMGPTFYTQLAYDFGTPQQTAQKYNLPTNVSNDLNSINNLTSFVDQTPVPASHPDSIVIPKINVDVPIVYPASADNNTILDALQHGVAHYPDTAEPGHAGNVFITGHSSYYWWSGGKYNNIFALLNKLTTGDLVYIYYKGDQFIYRINGSKVVNPNQVDVLDATANATLTLMTCTPVGTNLRRLIVTADLVGRPPVANSDFSSFQQIPKLPTILPLY